MQKLIEGPHRGDKIWAIEARPAHGPWHRWSEWCGVAGCLKEISFWNHGRDLLVLLVVFRGSMCFFKCPEDLELFRYNPVLMLPLLAKMRAHIPLANQ